MCVTGKTGRRIEFILAFLLVLAICDPQFAQGGEGSYNPRTAYEAYLKRRYGTEDERPAQDVIERRCREDMEHHFTILHADAPFLEYYVQVARLWRQSATEESLQELERFIEVCWKIESEEIGRMAPAVKAHYGRVWQELSEAWLNMWSRKASEREKAEVLLGALKVNSKHHLHFMSLHERIIKLGRAYRDSFYDIILNGQLRHDSMYALVRIIRAAAFRPTKNDLKKMIEHEDVQVVDSARIFLLTYLCNDPLGQELALADLNSGDYERVYKSLPLIRDYLRSPIDVERKRELFGALDERLRKLEEALDEGRVDVGKTPKGIVDLVAMALSLLLRWTPFVAEKTDELEHHMAWVERAVTEMALPKECVQWIKEIRSRLKGLRIK